ncbi:MAG: FtsP/CotA-like multicopper oxidase with cupredoxin domain, partial [Myxococcota bacterium]
MRWLLLLPLMACTPTQPLQWTLVTAHAPLLENAQPADAIDLDPNPDVVSIALTADETETGYAYNGQTPGPTIRVVRGNTLRVELTNQTDVPTTIHWHGLHVPWAMDGVPWKMPPVEPGESKVYEFVIDQAGTYWYHPHFDT